MAPRSTSSIFGLPAAPSIRTFTVTSPFGSSLPLEDRSMAAGGITTVPESARLRSKPTEPLTSMSPSSLFTRSEVVVTFPPPT